MKKSLISQENNQEDKNVVVESTTSEKPKKSVFSVIFNVLLIVLIIIGVVISFTAFITKSGSGVPNFFGYSPFAIQTESMVPTFYPGDLIIDKAVKTPSDVAKIQVGDVITFWTVIRGERVLNSHRVIQIVDNENYLSFNTQGDNNTLEDAMSVHQSEIVGVYKFKISQVGNFIDFLQTSKGFFMIIVLPCILFFIFELVNFFKALLRYQAEKVRLQYEHQNKKAEEGNNPN